MYFCKVSINQSISDLCHFAPTVELLSPMGMLTMSTADKTSIIKSLFSEEESAGNDTNNVKNINYATHFQTMQAGNRIRDHLY